MQAYNLIFDKIYEKERNKFELVLKETISNIKTIQMKNYLFLVLFAGILMSCEKESLNVTNLSANKGETSKARRLQPPPPPPGLIDVANLITCGNNISHLSSLQPINNTSTWWPLAGNNSSVTYLHDELYQAFHCSPYFSTCTIRLSGPPVSIEEVEFQVVDNGYIDFDPVLGDVTVYDYLSYNVSTSKAEELKEHFACTIKNYQNSVYPNNTYIHKVEFNGDALLCTCPSGQSRFLTAKVTFYRY